MTSRPNNQNRNPRRRSGDRLLFWFAAALIPEAASFHVESPRAMAQRAELLRQAQANDDAETGSDTAGADAAGAKAA